MLRFVGSVGLALATIGCAGVDLARLAPPGIIRYERIADEKPPNPTIAARIEERRDSEKPKIPKLGETAAGGAKMSRIPNTGVDDEVMRLETERENLEMAIATDMLESTASAQEADAINEAAADLSTAIEDAKTAAARERRSDHELADENEK